jgi:hypothetical protein
VSFAYEAATQHNQSGDLRPLTVIYIGDYDPAGVLIDVALERELRKHLNPLIELRFVRIGINEEQIALLNLPEKPRKVTDRRSLHVTCAVEAEAMPAHLLRALLRDSVEELLPEHALEVAKIAEASERQHIHRMADLMGSGGI